MLWCLNYVLTLFSVWVLRSNRILFLDNSFRVPVNTITEMGSGFIFAGDDSVIILFSTAAKVFFKHAKTAAELELEKTVASQRREVITRCLAENCYGFREKTALGRHEFGSLFKWNNKRFLDSLDGRRRKSTSRIW